jgi:hypothetical protein
MPIELDQWREGSAAIWTTESNEIARRLIYGEGPAALQAPYHAGGLASASPGRVS